MIANVLLLLLFTHELRRIMKAGYRKIQKQPNIVHWSLKRGNMKDKVKKRFTIFLHMAEGGILEFQARNTRKLSRPP